MSIEKYTSPSFILKHYDNGEDNVIMKVWTRDFGLIFVKAQSFRKSIKLRQHAGIARISNLTLVKGREYFRLAGAKEILYHNVYVAIISNIIERLIHGEEKMDILFDKYIDYLELVESYYKNIKRDQNSDLNIVIDINIFKICIMLETLYALGFFDLDSISYSQLKHYKDHIDYQSPEDVILFVQLNKNIVIDEIQKSLHNTML